MGPDQVSSPQPAADEPPVASLRHGPVLVVRFLSAPTLRTAEAVTALTDEAVRSGAGKLSFIGIVPGGVKVPSKEFRDRLAAQRETMRANTHSVHFVIEGQGLLPRLQRSMISAIASVVATNLKFMIHATGEEALLAVAADRKLDLQGLLLEARQLGLFGRAAAR